MLACLWSHTEHGIRVHDYWLDKSKRSLVYAYGQVDRAPKQVPFLYSCTINYRCRLVNWDIYKLNWHPLYAFWLILYIIKGLEIPKPLCFCRVSLFKFLNLIDEIFGYLFVSEWKFNVFTPQYNSKPGFFPLMVKEVIEEESYCSVHNAGFPNSYFCLRMCVPKKNHIASTCRTIPFYELFLGQHICATPLQITKKQWKCAK